MQASGKTSFVNVIGSGQVASAAGISEPSSFNDAERQWTEDVVPTVAFNYRKVRKGAVTLKIWDVAGQPKFRSMWERYCNGVDAVVYGLVPFSRVSFVLFLEPNPLLFFVMERKAHCP